MRLTSATVVLVIAAAIGVTMDPRSFLAIAAGAGVAVIAGVIAVAAGIFCAGGRFALSGWRRRNVAAAAALAAVAAAGVVLGARACRPPPLAPALARAIEDEGQVAIGGWVTAGPDAARGGSRLRVAIDRVDGVAVPPTVAAVAVVAGTPAVAPGDAVELAARLRGVRGLANPGVGDWTRLARAEGIDLFAGVGTAAAIQRREEVRGGPVARVARAAAAARTALGRAIDRAVPGAAGAMLHTVVLGERRETAPEVEEGFRAAGATHVLSVSGLHLAAVTAVFFVGARRVLGAVPVLPLWVHPRTLAAVLALAAVTFYTFLTGGAIATVRSALMAALVLGGVIIGRPSTALGAVAAAVAVLVCRSPLVLFDVSFQLSVTSVLALALLVRRLVPAAAAARAPAPAGAVASLAARLRRAGGRFAAATVAAGLATAPLVAHHFGEVTPAAPLGNLALVPLVELVVVPCGLGGAALGALAGPAWGFVPLTVAGWGARVALAIAEAFRAAAPIWLTRAPASVETAALMLGGAAALAAWPRAAPRRKAVATAALVLVAAAAASLTAREIARRTSRDLVVTFLDVGQGDAAVLEMPGDRVALIDGGGTYDGSFDPGERVVEPFLRARGITRLDLVVLSHPHPDHLGGLHRVLGRFAVGELWTSGDDGKNPEYGRLLAAAAARGVATPVPSRRRLGGGGGGGVVWEPLGPFSGDRTGERIGAPEGVSVNDASLVVRVAYAGRSLLFTGDIEGDGEGELAGRTALGADVGADVLKVPHHGSRTSSSDELLEAVRPWMAVMSLGWQNRFHFPASEVLDRYRDRGIPVLRTDLHGAVTVTVGAGGALGARCARGCSATAPAAPVAFTGTSRPGAAPAFAPGAR